MVGLILITAAIAIPNARRARMAPNESSAVGALRTINTGEVTYNSTYPTIGYFANLLSVGGPANAACAPASGSACLIDNVLSSGTKSGYTFVAVLWGSSESESGEHRSLLL